MRLGRVGGTGVRRRPMPGWLPAPPRVAAARQAAVLFMVSGTVLLLTHGFIQPPLQGDAIVRIMDTSALLTGVAVWLLPWHRWHPRTVLVTVPAAFALIAGANAVQPTPYEYGVFFIVIFGWVGLSQGRWICVIFAPLAATAYVVPLLAQHVVEPGALSSAFTVIPVGVLIGETIAAKVAQLTSARRESEHRLDLLRAVSKSSRVINTLDRSVVLSAVSRALQELGFAGSSFTFLSADGTRYRVEAARGMPAAYARGTHAVAGTLTEVVRDRRTTVVVDDYAAQIAGPALDAQQFRATIAAPLWLAGELVGAMIASKRELMLFTAEDLEAFEMLAAQAGRALENAGTFEGEVAVRHQFAADAVIDVLTGIGNRRHAMALLESLCPGDALALIDLDNFKNVNDTYGHAEGDAVLVKIGAFLTHALRDGDDVARYGGEEFLLVLRAAGADAAAVLRRLTHEWRFLGARTTFSTGFAVHPLGGDAAQTLAAADQALYAAKAAGRNCVRAG